MKQYKLTYSNQIKNELIAILLQIKSFNPQLAIKYKNSILTQIGKLKENPEIAPYLEGDYIPPRWYHKLVLKENYIVIYQIRENEVLIEHIFSAKQNYQWLI